MNKEQLFKLLNTNKKDNTGVKKPSKKRLKVVLRKYTGLSDMNTHIDYISGLNVNKTLIFEPVKRFRKKDLLPVTKEQMLQKTLEAEERDRKRKEKLLGNKEVPRKSVEHNDTFNNWFDVTGNKEKPVKNSKCTFTDMYGNSVSLDDSFEDYKDSNIVY